MQPPPQAPQVQYQPPPGGVPGGPPAGAPQAPKKKGRIGLVIGIGCGVLVLLGLCGLLASLGYYGFARYQQRAAEAEAGKSSDSSKSSKSSDSGSAGKIGVPACDEYIEKMEACADKVGEPGGKAIRDAARQTSDAWRNAVKQGGDAAKNALEQGCKTAIETSKSSYGSMGCDF